MSNDIDTKDLLIQLQNKVIDIDSKVHPLMVREAKVINFSKILQQRVNQFILKFDRDAYKKIDNKLYTIELASEVNTLVKFGYDIKGGHFINAISLILKNLIQLANESLVQYLNEEDDEKLKQTCYYLLGMINYNSGNFSESINYFDASYKLSLKGIPDLQSLTYILELMGFKRENPTEIIRVFKSIEEELLSNSPESLRSSLLLANLYLKFGNLFSDSILEPILKNQMIDNSKAIQYYKLAKTQCNSVQGNIIAEVIDFSLATSMLLSNKIDFSISKSPKELFRDVYNRLRLQLLTKTESIIIFQINLMLVASGYYAEIESEIKFHLQAARESLHMLPGNIMIFSPLSKELLTKENILTQIDIYFQNFIK